MLEQLPNGDWLDPFDVTAVRLTGAQGVSVVTRSGAVHEIGFADASAAAAFRDDYGARVQAAQRYDLEWLGGAVAENLGAAGTAIAEGAETVRKRAVSAFNALRGAKD